jgi:hypothetical protein
MDMSPLYLSGFRLGRTLGKVGSRAQMAGQVVGVITISTRRFSARPLAVLFEATGSAKPRPE